MSDESPTARLGRPRLRLCQRQGNANDALFKANVAVSEHRPEEALALYTHVLYEVAPGHVSALLNRSLCYILTGHYELAAMDAYRAAVASHDMRNDNVYFQNSRFLTERAYLRAEEIHVNNHEQWTRPSGRYIGDGWTSSPLASIVINDQPDVSKFHVPAAQLSTMNLSKFLLAERDNLCAALEVRAIYRLSGALFLCGGGARYDALGLLDDAMTNLDILQWERLHFTDLGSDIMADLTHEVDNGDRLISVKGIGHEAEYELSSASRAERLDAVKASSQSRSVFINHKEYPKWNKSKPDLSKQKWRKILQNWVQASGQGCTPRIVQPKKDVLNDCWTPYVELVAEKDFEPGELVMLESSIYNVTSHDGQQALVQGHLYYHFCSVCAALLITPIQNEKTGHPVPPRQGIIHPFADESKTSANPPSDHRTSSSSSQSFYRDLRFCDKKHMAPLCSETCAAMHNSFGHPGVCGTNLERDILLETLKEGLDLPSLCQAQREIKALHDLLLLRAMAHAIQRDKNLLHLPELAFATAGINLNNTLSPSSRSETPCHSWSFTNNIVKPISILHRLCRATRTDPFTHLGKTEGWVLNIVLTKIRTAAHITPSLLDASVPERSRHCAKLFDDDALLSASYLPLQPLPDHIHVAQDTEAVRVGRLNPVLDMIRFAEPGKGETPNVRFEHNGGVQVYATVKIAKGEPLLRAVAEHSW